MGQRPDVHPVCKRNVMLHIHLFKSPSAVNYKPHCTKKLSRQLKETWNLKRFDTFKRKLLLFYFVFVFVDNPKDASLV